MLSFPKVLTVALVVLIAGQSNALQTPVVSRRNILSKVVTTTTAATIVLVAGGADSAFAATAPTKKKQEQRAGAFRGGKEVLDAGHNGTELNERQAGVAGGLLDKMGITDIAPDKGGRGSGKKK
mmetsp:Transcript_14196/g.20975  ORF Transcript_14196/g.20975 Transcript_14196/m.20975 type:complete len:124 (+) Transcript_14196:198-569(+)|eukprot:CAMPEP_0194222896 /NCGR_PEP_ID=MMETSP0156-20130528/34023_1 /TAXON_ID=33649 /ORGANISM="Thalassionema nitzschioides, Strain L26-B" /LENGTH=123 /DNA_ID=CAMNT_0038953867 /DNA_START=140 /DNA_END=511 /DNA_ORIENTATION=-